MTATKTKTKKAWCVYAAELVDAIGRTYASGDGITASTRRLYALADSEAEAEAVKARLESTRLMTRARVPGDQTLYPVLAVDRYEPLDFVGRQDRDQESYGKRYAALCGRLADEAKRNAAGLA
jgi:hypothetical protein